ncbi:MAG TPA: hypothetical protein VHN98_04685 [Acidimicrobiales bacterium]|nr:hypothetical protein [Acidimicrobiales bacterium]
MRLAPTFPRVSERPAWLPHVARLLMALAVLVAVLAVLNNAGSHQRAQAAPAAAPTTTAKGTVGVAQPGEMRAGGQLVFPLAAGSLQVFTNRPVDARQVPVVEVEAHGVWVGAADAPVFVRSDRLPRGIAPGRAVDVTGWMVPVTPADRGLAGTGADAARLDAQRQLVDADHVTLH